MRAIMKRTATCPKCSGTKILHVRAVADGSSARQHTTGDDAPSTARLALRIAKQKALLSGSYDAALTEGQLQAFVCAGCGYVEQHVAVEELTVDGDFIRVYAAPASAYRG
jgi:hypothetical protein